jgi:threonine dehydrogenase-like Zn-dependent dehydrogenase
MRQWVLEDVGKLSMFEVPTPEPGNDEVRVRLRWVGLCGTDVEFFRGQYAIERLGKPALLGHEPAGFIDIIGSEVPPALVPGMPVTFRYRYGCFADYVCVNWRDLFVLPGQLDLRDGTLVEVLPSVLSAVDRARVDARASVLVLGQGTSGLLLTATLAQHFPRLLIAADLMPEREVLSRRLGAHGFVAPSSHSATVREIVQVFGCFDVVFVACYEPDIVDMAVNLANRSGRVVLYGGIGQARIDLYEAHRRRVDLLTAGLDHRQQEHDLYQRSVRCVLNGTVDSSLLHTHVFGFEEVADAFELRTTPRPAVIHVLVDIETPRLSGRSDQLA